MIFDLLTTVDQGGCSSKLPAAKLALALKVLPKITHPNLLVDIDTHDDAGVYKLSDTLALIQTVDFFPPVCSDPYEFGQIAAANALSDVYAMGGAALTAMNIVLFPSTKIPIEALTDILRGGLDKCTEAGALVVGGHTIDDYPPKYGLSVSGTVHPDRVITNAGARPSDIVILTKPVGTGTVIAGKRTRNAKEKDYAAALASMKLLNKHGAELMQEFNVKSATDITGFGLLGHALKLAKASGVSIRINSSNVPLLSGAYELADLGCLPGAGFRNLEFVEKECSFGEGLDYNLKMLLCDAQTSGGLFISTPAKNADALLARLKKEGYPASEVIGEVMASRSDQAVLSIL